MIVACILFVIFIVEKAYILIKLENNDKIT
jgi:hypothetical protein